HAVTSAPAAAQQARAGCEQGNSWGPAAGSPARQLGRSAACLLPSPSTPLTWPPTDVPPPTVCSTHTM
ncbi:hypothetical protein HaLaN_09005, partial [Haematococcus lacustris]